MLSKSLTYQDGTRRRNQKVFDNIDHEPQQVVDKARNLHAEYTGAHALKQQITGRNTTKLWRKPENGTIKINVHGAYCRITGLGALGVVARKVKKMERTLLTQTAVSAAAATVSCHLRSATTSTLEPELLQSEEATFPFTQG
ncbi:hypothetical protein V6N13_143601 [Hibiscus sabdariffa]